MGYYIDLRHITLDEFKQKLQSAELLPSQQILKDDLEKRFAILTAQQIQTLEQLHLRLKTTLKVQAFSEVTSLPVDYLTVLRREVNSYHPQPRAIRDFTCINQTIRADLERVGIKTTADLYENVATKHARKQFQDTLHLSDEDVLLLTKLTDVSRLRYVNQAFAALLVNSAYDTVDTIKQADYRELYDTLNRVNHEKGYYKGKIGLKDMKFFVEDTVFAASAIEY